MNKTGFIKGFKAAWLSTAVATLLAACGGGGGGGGGGVPQAGGGAANISGPVVKGLITGGSVNAQEVANGVLVAIGSSPIDANGQYSITVANYNGGPVLLTVDPTNASMTCDVQAGCGAVAFGGQVPLPANFVLRAVLPLASGNIVRPLTTYTELAAFRAIEIAGAETALTSSDINNALSEVGALLAGLPVLTTVPPDITDEAAATAAAADERSYAVLSAAALAFFGNGDPVAAIDGLESAFAGGVISGANLRGLAEAAEAEFKAAQVPDVSGVIAAMRLAARNAGDGNFDPQPNPNVNDAGITRAKTFVASARNLASDLRGQEGEATQFERRLETANDTFDTSADALGEETFDAFGELIDCYFDYAFFANSTDEDPDYGGPTNCSVMTTNSSGGMSMASVEITPNSPAGHDTATILGGVGDHAVDITAIIPQFDSLEDDAIDPLMADVTGTSERSGETRLTITAGSLEIIKVANPSGTSSNGDGESLLNDIDTVIFDWDLSVTDLTSAANTAARFKMGGEFRACGTCSEPTPELTSLTFLIEAESNESPSSAGQDESSVEIRLDLSNDPLIYTYTPGDDRIDDFISGTLMLAFSVNLEASGSNSLTFTASFEDFRIIIEQNESVDTRGAQSTGNATLIAQSQNNAQITATLDQDLNPINLRDQDGIDIDIPVDEFDVFPIIVAGDEVGSVSTEFGVVIFRYEDATFESF